MLDEKPVYGVVHQVEGEKTDYYLMHYASILQSMHNVLYVDCANSFDPYFIYKRSGKNQDALDRVHVVRPFTLYQLREFIVNKLEKELKKTSARSLLIPYVDAFGFDHTFQEKEYQVITGQITEKIKSITQDYQLFTVISMEEEKTDSQIIAKKCR